MTDVTQGQDAPNENALFNEAVSADTLAKFENPPPAPVEPAEKPAPAAAAADVKPGEQPGAQTQTTKLDEPVNVPAGRLREESEARRRAERERDDLRAQLLASGRQQPQQQQQREQPQAVDIFENPRGFVQQEMMPYLEHMRSEMQQQREAMSLDFALSKHGNDTVSAARQALEQGMSRGDPNAWGTYNRAMQSHDPYGVIVRAHQEQETLRSIGGDLNGYRARILEEALNDPAYRAKVIEAAKGQAAANGAHVARPAPAVTVASSPSLGNIGAGGGDTQVIEPSDGELFRQATSARRR